MRNGGEWTEARFHSFVKSALRAAKWPPKYKALEDAFTSIKLNDKTGRLAKHYRCKACQGEFPAKDVQVDHIRPVINPLTGFVSWDETIERLYCEQEFFQVLCKPCHKDKTTVERQQAKERKNNG